MARKEVLVQLDDAMVERLDALAEKLGISRSELLRRGAAAVLEAADWAQADEELVAAYRAIPQEDDLIEFVTRLAAQNVPDW